MLAKCERKYNTAIQLARQSTTSWKHDSQLIPHNKNTRSLTMPYHIQLQGGAFHCQKSTLYDTV